jgi:hypothetical protein
MKKAHGVIFETGFLFWANTTQQAGWNIFCMCQKMCAIGLKTIDK